MGKFLNIEVSTLNGEILEFPYVQQFNCDSVQPIGVQNIRDYDVNNCIVVKTVYLLLEKENVFGTTEITTKQQFESLKLAACNTCGNIGTCILRYNGCILSFNGCDIIYN